MNDNDILTQLIALEPIFHRWEHLAGQPPTRADFERITTSGFFEIGASGAIYTRSFMLDLLEQRYADPSYRDTPWTANTFQLRQLADDTYLLTYILLQHQSTGDRTTRRSTIWKNTESGWQITFHQGTIVQQS